MAFDYSKLLGRIRERKMTQEQLANSIGINKCTLSSKFNGRHSFNADEMDSICKVLDIPNTEIGVYFFTK